MHKTSKTINLYTSFHYFLMLTIKWTKCSDKFESNEPSKDNVIFPQMLFNKTECYLNDKG